MTWFAASLIVGIRRIDAPDRQIVAYENVVLIEATTSEEAFKKAQEYGEAYAAVDDGFTLDDKPTVKTFAGVRKLINVSNPHPLDLDQDRPVCGTEVTYSLFELDDSDALTSLASGKEVSLRYVE
jgi:hypothetical protein